MENRLIVRYHLRVMKRQGRWNEGNAGRWSCPVEGVRSNPHADPELEGQPEDKVVGGPDEKS